MGGGGAVLGASARDGGKYRKFKSCDLHASATGTTSHDDAAKKGITRRGFVKTALVLGGASVAAVGGYAALQTLTPQRERQVQSTFLYVNPVGAQLPVWFVEQGLVGEEARITHFEPGNGANVLWRVELDEKGAVSAGLPALLIMMDEETLEFPTGYARSEFVIQGLYAVFNCCTHSCCRPGWQLIPRSHYLDDLGHENIYCVCHDSQFDPRRLAEYTHDPPSKASGAAYLGVYVEPQTGPAKIGMPLIPIGLEGDRIVGRLSYPEWYRYLDFKEPREL